MPRSAPYRTAIIGAGIGASHVAGFMELHDQYRLVAVCDLDEDKASALAAKAGGCTVATEFDQVIADRDVDIVDICLPPTLHSEAVLKALAAGKHVICEKPLACSLDEIDRIIAAAEQAGKLVLPVFQYRYGRGFAQLLELIGAGICGDALTGTLETHWNRGADYYSVPWRGTWEGESGGAVLGHAIHLHDLLCRALGPVATVAALLGTRVNAVEVDDCAAIAMTMKSGALVTSSITLGSAQDMSRLRFCFQNVTAESGRSPYHPGGDGWTFQAREPTAQDDVDAIVTACERPVERFAGLFGEFAKRLLSEPNHAVTLGEARRSLELVTAIYQSARSGEVEQLPVPDDHPLYRGWAPD